MGITITIYIAQIIEVCTLVIGFYTFKVLPKSFKILLVLVSVSTLFDLTMYTITDLIGQNYFLVHFYTPIDFLLIILFLFHFISKKYSNSLSWIIISGYLIFWLIAKITFEPLDRMDNYSSSIAKGIVVLVTTYAFIMRAIYSNRLLSKDPVSYAMIGILIYYGGSLFVEALSNLIFAQDLETANILWKIHTILHILFDFSLITAFLLIEKCDLIVKKISS